MNSYVSKLYEQKQYVDEKITLGVECDEDIDNLKKDIVDYVQENRLLELMLGTGCIEVVISSGEESEDDEMNTFIITECWRYDKDNPLIYLQINRCDGSGACLVRQDMFNKEEDEVDM